MPRNRDEQVRAKATASDGPESTVMPTDEPKTFQEEVKRAFKMHQTKKAVWQALKDVGVRHERAAVEHGSMAILPPPDPL